MAEEQFQKVRVDRRRVVPTIVTTSATVAEEWIRDMKSWFYDSTTGIPLMVGLDMELAGGRVATVQFTIAQHCLIYRSIMAVEPLPPPLTHLLLDYKNNIFVGLGLDYKLGILRQELGFEATPIPYIELRDHAARVYPDLDLINAGPLQVAAAVLPRWVVVRSVADGNWDAPKLSYADMEYACTAPFISLQIARCLLNATLIRSELDKIGLE